MLGLLCLLFAVAVSPAEEGMRWRVFCDPIAGIALRVPYGFVMPDPSRGEFLRPGGGLIAVRSPAGGMERRWQIDGQGRPLADLVIRSEEADPVELEQRAEVLAGWGACLWEPEDYYRDPDRRPFARRPWAPDGVVVRRGRAGSGSLLAVGHGGRVGVVAIRGIPDRVVEDREIIDGVEVLGRSGLTWRESQAAAGLVLDAQGRPVRPGRIQATAWESAWEVETAHYHLTGSVAPAQLLRRAALLEALHQAYRDIYRPERLPLVKAEVHLVATAAEYQRLCRQWVDPGFQVAGPAGINGGFFDPDAMAIWLYEESGGLGGPALAVERVAAHECSHQFVHLACAGGGRVPTWLNEGLAVYFEAGEWQDGRFRPCPPRDRLERLRTAYRDRGDLLRPLEWHLANQGPLEPEVYAEVYAMVHFWLFGQCGPGCDPARGRHPACGRRRFADWWQALRSGESGQEAFERIFMGDLVRIHGGRRQALSAWRQALLAYVLAGKAEKLP